MVIMGRFLAEGNIDLIGKVAYLNAKTTNLTTEVVGLAAAVVDHVRRRPCTTPARASWVL